MVVATAEQIDFELWEREISLERPAEGEVYGRSLSTIHKLGAFMVEHSLEESVKSPEADQARVEFYTSVEEGFGTDMELGGGLEVRDFDTRAIMNGKVMAKDLKTAVSDMTAAGLACGIMTAERDQRFLPQLTRSERDHENALIVDKMVQGKTAYNTRIVISPFPEEAAAQSGNDYWRNIGYVPHLKRGFVQLYHAGKDELVSGSLSFDGSNKQRLRELFAKRGVNIPADEVTDNWLQYAITDTLSEHDAMELALEIADLAADPKYKKNTNTVDVTGKYKSVMDTAFDESYVHVCESLYRGHQTPGLRSLVFQLADNAQYFNDRYKRALYRMRSNEANFTDEDSAILHELLVYSTIEMMRALHLKQANGKPGNNLATGVAIGYLQNMNQVAFQHMLGDMAAEGARSHRVYSACGLAIDLSVRSELDGTGLDELDLSRDPQHAFAGKDKGSEKKTVDAGDGKGSLIFRCKLGHWNMRKKFAPLETRCRVKSCKKGSVGC